MSSNYMQDLLESSGPGSIFVVSAPAGTGKTTLVQRLTKEFPSVIASISYTTRPLRGEEKAGRDYNFIDTEEFEKRIEEGDFLEYVQLYGIYYGTSREWVSEKQKQGKHVVLVIDTQGAAQLRGKVPAVFIFIRPPSMEELKKRLWGRGTEKPEMIEKRLAWAQHEMEQADQYDYQIVNNEIDRAYEVLKSIIVAECHRTKN